MYQWPIEAFQGLLFTLVWPVGVLKVWDFFAAALSILIVLVLLFVAGKNDFEVFGFKLANFPVKIHEKSNAERKTAHCGGSA
ncbi:hypothetical protein [Marinobacter sp. AL4B]|uniref:hypothetical protein n=1 Tax=Marinobacter sp. AL4B TaxID=2871173 RepID=UPI001CAA5028|nr:hypothetical protein [Marinobacter sp. AL4B]MBZ0332873.1 hypothetical protein [Marinobacter sp. AL4B]